MKFHECVGPYPVAVITTEGAGGRHSAPFSWIVPTGKDNQFLVMMRKTSRTLQKIQEDGEVSLLIVELMQADPSVAQAVLEMKAPELKESVDSLKTKTLARCRVTNLVEMDQYVAVCMTAEDVMDTKRGKQLLHHGGKKFSFGTDFEVKGY